MKWLAILLLLGVFIRHDAANWLAGSISPAGWFFLLGGLWEALLCTLLLAVVLQQPGPWRALSVAALVIGIVEALQMSVCRLVISPAAYEAMPNGSNICDYLLGFQLGAPIVAFELFVVCVALGLSWRSASRS